MKLWLASDVPEPATRPYPEPRKNSRRRGEATAWSVVGGVLLALGGAAVAACGAVDADRDPFAGTTEYMSSAGGYSFRYLSPPWVVVRNGRDTVEMVVARSLTNVDPDDYRYHLKVAPIEGNFEALAAGITGTRTRVAGPDGDDIGAMVSGGAGSLYLLDAFFPGAVQGRAFHMRFTALSDMAADPLVATMVSSFRVRADPGGGTGGGGMGGGGGAGGAAGAGGQGGRAGGSNGSGGDR